MERKLPHVGWATPLDREILPLTEPSRSDRRPTTADQDHAGGRIPGWRRSRTRSSIHLILILTSRPALCWLHRFKNPQAEHDSWLCLGMRLFSRRNIRKKTRFLSQRQGIKEKRMQDDINANNWHRRHRRRQLHRRHWRQQLE